MAMEGEEDFDSLFEGMDFVNPLSYDTATPSPPSPSVPLDPHQLHDSSGQDHIIADLENLPDCQALSLQRQNSVDQDGKQRGSPIVESQRSIESIMAAYNKVDPAPSLTKSTSLKNSGETSKSGVRRKKRSVKIGYGRGGDSIEEQKLSVGEQDNTNGIEVEAATGWGNASHKGVVEEENDIKSFSVDKIDSLTSSARTSISDTVVDRPEIPYSISNTLDTSDADLTAVSSAEEVQDHAIQHHPVGQKCKNNSATLESVPASEVELDRASPPENGHPHGETDGSIMSASSQGMEVDRLPDGNDALELCIHVPSGSSVEESLEFIRKAMAKNAEKIQSRISAVSQARKVAAQKRRLMAEKVSTSLSRLKEVEQELEAACESEDFEKAESLSEKLAIAEKAREAALEDFRAAEMDYDQYAFKIQDVIQMQIANEEEAAQLLERLGQDAIDRANGAKVDAESKGKKEMDALIAEEEALKLKKKKLILELRVIDEAKAELNNAIQSATQAELEEKQLLAEEQQVLSKELSDLLEAVKLKQAQIAERDKRIEALEDKISKTVTTFEKESMDLKSNFDNLSCMLESLEKESEDLAAKKQDIEHEATRVQEEELKLEFFASTAKKEAQSLREALQIRKSLSLSALNSKKKMSDLALEEKQHVETAQSLRSQASSIRASLQELASERTKLHQQSQSVSQQITLMEKRGPEIEAEKKLAAVARNFKEAGRLASEAKALVLTREKATIELDRITTELQKLDLDLEVQMKTLSELEEQLLKEEREAAMARCERLRLLAAAARDERDAAAELEDFEEAESLHLEAEAADQEADELKARYGFESSVYCRTMSKVRDASAISSDVVNPVELESQMSECAINISEGVGADTDL